MPATRDSQALFLRCVTQRYSGLFLCKFICAPDFVCHQAWICMAAGAGLGHFLLVGWLAALPFLKKFVNIMGTL